MDANVALPAALIGDPARAAILMSLMDGRAQPAGALAWAAGLTAPAASNHLARLVDGGLLRVEREGRHRYYRLAGPEVAAALEGLAAIAPAVKALEAPRCRAGRALRDGRTCYDHLAGRLGVAIAEALQARGLVTVPAEDGKAFALTAAGAAWFAGLGVDTDPRGAARPFARRCLDWTERRHHLAGPLGARLARRLFELGWITRGELGRSVRLTPAGARGLEDALGLDVRAPELALAS